MRIFMERLKSEDERQERESPAVPPPPGRNYHTAAVDPPLGREEERCEKMGRDRNIRNKW